MVSFKYFVCIVTVVCLTALIISGCGSKGTTTKFRFTPIGTIEDGTTDPQRLTEDLDVLLQSEDSKRMRQLQEEAKVKDEKEKNTSMQRGVETK